jgi:hypothetical protein
LLDLLTGKLDWQRAEVPGEDAIEFRCTSKERTEAHQVKRGISGGGHWTIAALRDVVDDLEDCWQQIPFYGACSHLSTLRRKWKPHDSRIRPGRVRTRVGTSRASSGGRDAPLDGTRNPFDSAWRNSIDRENGPGTTRCRHTAIRRADADRCAPERWQVHNLRRWDQWYRQDSRSSQFAAEANAPICWIDCGLVTSQLEALSAIGEFLVEQTNVVRSY